jgi:hypothetical protein
MAKHVDNNGREKPIIARNMWLWYHIKVYEPYSPSKDALREEGTPWLIKCPGEGNLSDVEHFNIPPPPKKKGLYFEIFIVLMQIVFVLTFVAHIIP